MGRSCRERPAGFEAQFMLPAVREVIFIEETLFEAQVQIAQEDVIGELGEPRAARLVEAIVARGWQSDADAHPTSHRQFASCNADRPAFDRNAAVVGARWPG
jgi:hypothetical protein